MGRANRHWSRTQMVSRIILGHYAYELLQQHHQECLFFSVSYHVISCHVISLCFIAISTLCGQGPTAVVYI